MVELKELPEKKASLKALKESPAGRTRKNPRKLPELSPIPSMRDLLSPQIREYSKLLGDERLAKRIVTLQGEYPMASVPELVAYDWLSGNQIPFRFQVSLFGGRLIRGGQVPDFVISLGGFAQVWRIQGQYYHTRPGQRSNDLTEKLQMLGAEVDGQQIREVVDIWDGPILDANRREKAFKLALSGVEIGQ